MFRIYSAIILSVGALTAVPTELPKVPRTPLVALEELIVGPANVEEKVEPTPTSTPVPTPTATPKPTKTYIEKAIGYSPSKKEIDLLERLVFCEAGNQTIECKIAVVNVVINRVKSKEFPNTITEVINQKGQFSPVGSGWIKTVTATEECKEAVQLALNGKQIVTNNTKYFFATWLDKNHSMWKRTNITKTIGKVAFGERN